MSRWDTLIVMLEDIAHHTDRDDVREALEEARRGKLANDSAWEASTDLVPRRRKPYKPDAVRVEDGDWIRAAGDVLCKTCGYAYREHAPIVGFEWLHMLCNGKIVKL